MTSFQQKRMYLKFLLSGYTVIKLRNSTSPPIEATLTEEEVIEYLDNGWEVVIT